jgi:site-specific DNA recombinase
MVLSENGDSVNTIGYLRGTADEQIKTISKYIETNKIEFKKFYRDPTGAGNKVSNRPGYLKIIEEHESWDTIIVTSLDILHTNMENMFIFLKFLLVYNKDIISINEKINTKESKQFLYGADALKKIFDFSIGEYIPKPMIKKAHLDTWLTKPPYGYKVVTLLDTKKILHPYEPEALVIQFIFDSRSRGNSYGSIAGILNNRGVPSPGGKRWTANKIMRILSNKIYWGYREIYDESGDKIWVKHNYKCIIDEKTGNLAYQMRAIRKQRKK